MENSKAATTFMVLMMAMTMVATTKSLEPQEEMMAGDILEIVIEHPALPQNIGRSIRPGGQKNFGLNGRGEGWDGGRTRATNGGGDIGNGGGDRAGGDGGGGKKRGHDGRDGYREAGNGPPHSNPESSNPFSSVMGSLRNLRQMVQKGLDNVRNSVSSTTTRTLNGFLRMTGSTSMNGRRRPSRAKNRSPNKRNPDHTNANENYRHASSPSTSSSFPTSNLETFSDHGPPKVSSIISTFENNPHPNGQHSHIPTPRPLIHQPSHTDMKVINIHIPEKLQNAPVFEISLNSDGDVSHGSATPGDEPGPTISPTSRTVTSIPLHHPSTHSTFSVIRTNPGSGVPLTDDKSSDLAGSLNQTIHTRLANFPVSQNNPSHSTNQKTLDSIQDILRQGNLDDSAGRLNKDGLENAALLNQMSRSQLANILASQINPSFNTNIKPITSVHHRLRGPLGPKSNIDPLVLSEDTLKNENIFNTGSAPQWPSSFPAQSSPQFYPSEYHRPNVNHIYLLPFDAEPSTHPLQSDSSLVPQGPPLPTLKPSSTAEEQNIYYIDITIPEKGSSKPLVTAERNNRRRRSLQFDGWFPVDSNNPMQDPPTLHYRPPPLERVHFGHDPPPEKPMFPVRPENPPVFVVRVENNRPELHEVYGTEQVDYFHINPQTNTVRAFRKEDGGVPQFAHSGSDIESQQQASPTSSQKSFAEAHSEAFAEDFVDSHIDKIFHQEQHPAEQKQETPGQNGDFAEKVFVVGNYDYDTAGSGRIRFPEEGAEYQGELEPAFSDHAPETIVPSPEHMFPESPEEYSQPPKGRSGDSTTSFSTFPQERSGVGSILKEDRPAPALYELLRNFHETQIEESPYQASASEISRQNVMREVPPPNFFRRPTTDPERRRDAPRKRPAAGSNRPWFLIETRATTDSSKHRYDIPHPFYKDAARKTNDKTQYKTAFPHSPKNRGRSDLDNVPNPHLDDHMNSYKASNSLTATSLSELLQIFQFTAVTTPTPVNTDPTTMRSFRYTRPTDEPTTTPFPSTIRPARAHNTFRYTTAAVKESTDAYVTEEPKVRFDDVADTNSLDGYLFSDSETNPEYARPETRTNVIVIPKKDEEEHQQSGSQKSGVGRHSAAENSETSGSSSQTSDASNQTSNVSSQTSGVSSQTSGVSSQTSGVSSQTSGVSRQTSGISKQTSRISVSSNGHTIETYQPPVTSEKPEPVIEVVYRGSVSTTTESTTTTTTTTETDEAAETPVGTWPRYVVIQRNSKVKVFGINSEEEEKNVRDRSIAGFTLFDTSIASTTPSPPTVTSASTGAHTPTFRAYSASSKNEDRITLVPEESLREITPTTEENIPANTETVFIVDLEETDSSVKKEPEHISTSAPERLPPPDPTQLTRQNEPESIASPSEAFAHAFHTRLPPVRRHTQKESADFIDAVSDLGEPIRRSDSEATRPVFFTKRRSEEPTALLVEDETGGVVASSLSQPFEYVEQLKALERDLRVQSRVPPATENPVRKTLQIERIPTETRL